MAIHRNMVLTPNTVTFESLFLSTIYRFGLYLGNNTTIIIIIIILYFNNSSTDAIILLVGIYKTILFTLSNKIYYRTH